MTEKTTCSRSECKLYNTCTFNIWKMTGKPEGCEGYMSRHMAIYKYYTEKCEKEGTVPMPYNIYFEH